MSDDPTDRIICAPKLHGYLSDGFESEFELSVGKPTSWMPLPSPPDHTTD